ncbi:lipopolysaccharide assembly protein LapA domain-containing protein [Pseudomonas sp. Root562]|uniref:lipopolysaccharide assembly protein LapA domain-containing protein n=1 Tax=Pseudomonas sp. Root562 TaxID=1736561 RepID=UPI0009E66199|nr:LapA family protein [Pseudomonas sp. Root562]
MSNLKRLLLGLILLLLVVAVLVFVLENQQPVTLAFFGWVAPRLPLAGVTIGSLLIGLVIGPLIGLLLNRAGRSGN